jgi:hypothetical protein
MPRKRLPEDPEPHDRWLVSYADFITLLFAFFVVMYAISQVNESKYRVLSDSLVQAFQNPSRLPDAQSPTNSPRSPVGLEHGGIVEVHIAGGSVILPEFYESRWSEGSHGLFASRAADGTVTLTAVAWDAIQKIIVRQVNGLPDGMFE